MYFLLADRVWKITISISIYFIEHPS